MGLYFEVLQEKHLLQGLKNFFFKKVKLKLTFFAEVPNFETASVEIEVYSSFSEVVSVGSQS